MLASTPSPFKVSGDSQAIGLGVERRQRRRAFLRRTLRWTTSLLSIGLVWWMFQGGLQWFLQTFVWSNQALALKRFQVKSHGVIPQQLLIQWTGLKPGDNLLAFHLSEIKRNLELSPFVMEATVERLFPETLRIHVQERQPVARVRLLKPDVRHDGSIGLLPLLMDAEGVVMPMPEEGEIPRSLTLKWQQLPEIVNVSEVSFQVGQSVDHPVFRAAVQWVSAFQASVLSEKIQIETVHVTQLDQLEVHTGDGQRILFALSRFDEQLAKWHQVMDYGLRIGRRLAFLDLTIKNNVPIEWFSEDGLQAEEHQHRIPPIDLNHVDV